MKDAEALRKIHVLTQERDALRRDLDAALAEISLLRREIEVLSAGVVLSA